MSYYRNFFLIFILFQIKISLYSQNNSRVITTGVPFLLISPDARSAGMGELGVATSPDVFSQQWNPSKYVFADEGKKIGLSYTPYLSKLVNDIFLANITYSLKKNDRSAWGFSLKYFSLGDIQFNDLVGNTIVQQGIERPNELTLDASFGLKLNQSFSMAVAARYIRSDLKLSSDADPTPANSIGIDISGFYNGKSFKFKKKNIRFRHGFNISNIGPRLKYDEGGQKNFIPTNIKVGSSLDLIMDESSVLSFNLEFNKLLVPSPIATYKDGVFIGYQQPDVSFIKGIFESFTDAPGGFSEELKEITWAFGLEYVFQKSLALRTGYFNESLDKGSRRFLTLGAGFGIDFANIDISYLFSTSKIRNPLENTLRFSITFPLRGQNTEIDQDNGEFTNN
ncbi:type IX secretion system outer membrane channel protein PorV [Bacteroidota bacterium]|nr:type IX secretion system outer membrane channel protein PorV [Bacteroidota bacterium]MEC8600011.1 type IX secretion system outer membrane channel protein PorV [Bacteroidota bacterium]